jgi:riboflavin transporter 2
MTYNLQINYRFKGIACSRAIIHLLVILFGISGWMGINGIFVEIPLFLDVAPEGLNLPAYIVIAAQVANVGPAIYGCLHKCKCQLNETLCILCLMCLHIFAIGVLIFYQNTKILLIVAFFSGLVGCFSSILFMPHLCDFDTVYIVSYFIGEGLSGVLPCITALIQGIGKSARYNVTAVGNATESVSLNDLTFSERYYFLFLTLVLILSLNAFILLRYSPFVQSRKNLHNSNFFTQSNIQLVNYKRRDEVDATVNVWYINDTQNHVSPGEEVEMANDSTIEKANDLSVFRKTYFYILIGTYSFFNIGFLPSIQSYSCLPYGQFAYQLSIICILFVQPFAYFLVLWIVLSDIKVINCLSLICLIAGCYLMCTVLLFPTPPLQKSTVGVSLLVLSWITVMGLTSYLKLMIISLLKRVSSSMTLFYIGIVIQTGATLGAIVSSVLINFRLFQSA